MPEEANRLTGRSTIARNVGLVMLALVLAAVVIAAPSANWDLALLAVLLGFAGFSDLTAKVIEDRLNISGNFPALILAMVFLGGSPAALMVLATSGAAFAQNPPAPENRSFLSACPLSSAWVNPAFGTCFSASFSDRSIV